MSGHEDALPKKGHKETVATGGQQLFCMHSVLISD